MIEVQSKTVVNQEKIATCLKSIVDEQKALTDAQTALKDELITGALMNKLEKVHVNTLFSKHLFTIISVVVIIGFVILKVFNL